MVLRSYTSDVINDARDGAPNGIFMNEQLIDPLCVLLRHVIYLSVIMYTVGGIRNGKEEGMKFDGERNKKLVSRTVTRVTRGL